MSLSLHIGERFSLPIDVVTQTVAVLAKRRAGKSYAMRRLAEQLFKAGEQIVIVDPKGDQWGIRSAADGKGPGLPVVILGGERGDVPLEPSGGEVVAKLVVEERVSVLLDLSLFRKHEVATFMTAFLENLYRLKAKEQYRTPMMLMVDEADAIAPQKPQKGEERMLGAAEDIVRRGGQRGIGCTLVTQRSAVLNKNVLTQAQILVALRTIAPQDLAAMSAWFDVHGTEKQTQTLMESLPSLPVGDAWFWSPGWPTEEGIFRRVHVLPIETFDSGATPKSGEKRLEPKKPADVDLDALKRQMAATIEKAKADDPRELRKRIAELERAKPATLTPKRVEVAVITDKQIATFGKIAERISAEAERHGKAMAMFWENQDQVAQALLHAMMAFANKPEPRRAPEAPPRRAPRPVPQGNGADSNLGKAQEKILATLAQHGECTIGRLALLSGYRVSGGFKNDLGALRTAGYIEGQNTGTMKITDSGLELKIWPELPIGRELFNFWVDKAKGPCQKKIIQVLDGRKNGFTIDELAEATGYRISGGFKNDLGALRTAGVIVGRNAEKMRLNDELLC